MSQNKECRKVKLEAMILLAVPIISLSSLIFIPKNMLFKAQFIFLFVQFITWILGILAVQAGLIEYPYRELSTVNRTSFIFEFLVLPIMCIHFYSHFPKRSSVAVKCMYYFAVTLVFTVIEYFVERYTFILKYTGWKLYWTFISIGFVFWLSKKITNWFFR
jgi:hypothetical protein